MSKALKAFVEGTSPVQAHIRRLLWCAKGGEALSAFTGLPLSNLLVYVNQAQQDRWVRVPLNSNPYVIVPAAERLVKYADIWVILTGQPDITGFIMSREALGQRISGGSASYWRHPTNRQ